MKIMNGEKSRSAVARIRGKVAAKIRDPKQRRAYIARQGEAEARERLGSRDVGDNPNIVALRSLEDYARQYRPKGAAVRGAKRYRRRNSR